MVICHVAAAAAAAKSLQSCPTLCDPIDGSLPGPTVPGILQARTLEWVAIFFSSAWKWEVKVKSLSRVQLFTTPWTVAYQAPLSMGFPRQEYWSGLPLPSPLRHIDIFIKTLRICFLLFYALKLTPKSEHLVFWMWSPSYEMRLEAIEKGTQINSHMLRGKKSSKYIG